MQAPLIEATIQKVGIAGAEIPNVQVEVSMLLKQNPQYSQDSGLDTDKGVQISKLMTTATSTNS